MKLTQYPFLLLSSCILMACNGSGSDNDKRDHNQSQCKPEYVNFTAAAGQPTLKLMGNKVVNLPIGGEYIEQGAVALDAEDGDLSSRVTITGVDSLTTQAVGDFLVRYEVKDDDGHRAIPVYRIIRVHNEGATQRFSKRFFNQVDAIWEYYEKLPNQLEPDVKYPLLIINHGAMHSKSFDNGGMKAMESTNGVVLLNKDQYPQDLPMIILVPQRCNVSLGADTTQSLHDFVLWAEHHYPVDSSRIYISGLSNGGTLTFNYAETFPEKPAAIVPMASDQIYQYCQLNTTPTWAFIARNDGIFSHDFLAHQMKQAAQCDGIEVQHRTTIFERGGHVIDDDILNLNYLGKGDPTFDVYDQSIYEWLMSHSKTKNSSI